MPSSKPAPDTILCLSHHRANAWRTRYTMHIDENWNIWSSHAFCICIVWLQVEHAQQRAGEVSNNARSCRTAGKTLPEGAGRAAKQTACRGSPADLWFQHSRPSRPKHFILLTSLFPDISFCPHIFPLAPLSLISWHLFLPSTLSPGISLSLDIPFPWHLFLLSSLFLDICSLEICFSHISFSWHLFPLAPLSLDLSLSHSLLTTLSLGIPFCWHLLVLTSLSLSTSPSCHPFSLASLSFDIFNATAPGRNSSTCCTRLSQVSLHASKKK